MEYNQRGYLTGRIAGMRRVGAHRFEIPSETNQGQKYEVYVESISPAVYRCTCKRFLFVGGCKHGIIVANAEKVFAKTYPIDYKSEKKEQKVNLSAARAELSRFTKEIVARLKPSRKR